MTAEAAARASQLPVDRTRLRALRPVLDSNGPHVRLGILWAAVVMVALVISPVVLAVIAAVVAGLAATQTSWTWPAAERPLPAGAGALGVLFPLIALAGGWAVVVTAAVLGAAAFVVAKRSTLHPTRTAVLGVVLGLAGASLVLARGLGFTEGLVLFLTIACYDASAYVVGTGAQNPWEGPAAGAASIGALTLAVAALFAGVFGGPSPWILGVAVAVLAPVGTYAASALCGPERKRTPALRRLDSLIIAGPVWVALATLMVGR